MHGEDRETRPAQGMEISPETAAMARAMKAIRTLRPPCFRRGCRETATTIVSTYGNPLAYCSECAQRAELNQRWRNLQIERAAMRR